MTQLRRVHWVTAGLAAGILALTALFVWLATTANRDQERHILDRRAHAAASLVTVAVDQIGSDLSAAAAVLQATGDAQLALDAISATARFDRAGIVDLSGDRASMVATVGEPFPPDPGAARAPIYLLAATEPGVHPTQVLVEGGESWLGFALGVPGGRVVYGESRTGADLSGGLLFTDPFTELDLVVYATPAARDDQLVLSKADELPLPGGARLAPFRAGASNWSVQVAQRTSLIGAAAERLPTLIAVAGILLALAAAGLVESLVRRRLFALQLVDERTRDLSHLLGVEEAIASSLEFDEVASVAAAQVRAATDATSVGLFLPADGKGGLQRVAVAGHPSLPLEWEEATVAAVARSGRDRVIRLPGTRPAGALVIRGGDEVRDEVLVAMATAVGTALQNARRFEAEQRLATEHAEISRMKTVFVGMVTHELRTPITVVRGLSNALRMRGDSLDREQQLEAAKRIEAQAMRLSTLVDDLLDATRLEAGQLEVSLHAVAVSELEEGLRQSFADRTTGLVISLDESLPPIVADVHRLEQVVTNLVDNAIKYSKPNSPVTVTATAADGAVAITVADQGVGIDKDLIPALFEPFTQADKLAKAPGAGLGLYITKRLVEIMGGEIGLTSAPGRGTTVTVTLPIASPGDLAADAADERGLLDSEITRQSTPTTEPG